jgi:hypothetical protein
MATEKHAEKSWLGSDLVSEILMLGGTGAIIITLLLLLLAAFGHS